MTGRLRLLLAGLLLVYPAWLLPNLGAGSLAVLLGIFALAAFGAPAIAARLAPGEPDSPRKEDPPFDRRLFWSLAAVSVLLRAPGAALPVIPVSDAMLHQGAPAALWEQIARRVPLATLAAWGVAVFLYLSRRTLPRLADRAGNPALFLGLLLGAAILAGAPGLAADPRLVALQRYPPLGKILALGGHALFGVREAVLPGIQTAFVVGTAWILGRWGDRLRPGAGIVSSSAWLFAPVFLSPAYLGHLEAGTVFLLAATLDGALRILEGERGAAYERYLAVFFAGLLYKELQLAAFAILPAILLLARAPLRLSSAFLVPPLLVAAPFLVGSRLHNAPTRLAIEALSNPDTILPTLAPLLWGWGPVILLLSLAGITRLAALSPDRLRARGMLAWFVLGAGFLWISPAWSYLRHSAIFFPPVALGLAGAVPDRARPGTVRLLALAAAFLGAAQVVPRASELVTLGNWRSHYLPYESAIAALPDGARVYAPMIVEPSRFYLAKTGRARAVDYRRHLWFDPATKAPDRAGLLAEADRIGASHLLLPSPYRPAWMSPHERLVAGHRVWRAQNAGRPGGGWDVGALGPDLDALLADPPPPWREAGRFRLGRGVLVLLARSDTISR